ncbi:MAG: ATP-binding protein, partial [Myxococcota bacterium]|nr:ATP-binding protein [Myxococcota bacterium]
VGDFEEVIADERQLRQLFQNLIANAIKFQSAERPLRVDVFQAPEPAHAMLDRPHLQLIVSDNGIGFDQDRAARIFEPFQRLHTEQEIKGSGIGLAICRRVVERHGGRIWAEGEPGKGASFHILLPLAPSEHAQNSRSRDSSTL